MTTLDYHLPAVGDVLFERCRDEPRREDSAVLAGVVRDSGFRPVSGATVRIQWTEYRVRSASIGRAVSGLQTTADARGFYLFCGVPTDMLISVQGLVGEDESDSYEVRIGVGQGAQLQAVEIVRDEDR